MFFFLICIYTYILLLFIKIVRFRIGRQRDIMYVFWMHWVFKLRRCESSPFSSRPSFPVKKLFRSFQIVRFPRTRTGRVPVTVIKVSRQTVQTSRKNFTGADDRRRGNSDGDQRELSRGTYPGTALRHIDFEKQTNKSIWRDTHPGLHPIDGHVRENDGIQRTQWRNCFADLRGGAPATCPTRVNLA